MWNNNGDGSALFHVTEETTDLVGRWLPPYLNDSVVIVFTICGIRGVLSTAAVFNDEKSLQQVVALASQVATDHILCNLIWPSSRRVAAVTSLVLLRARGLPARSGVYSETRILGHSMIWTSYRSAIRPVLQVFHNRKNPENNNPL